MMVEETTRTRAAWSRGIGRRWSLAVAVALLALGCSGGGGDRCAADGDCPAGELCDVRGECFVPCREDADCAGRPGTSCDPRGRCVGGDAGVDRCSTDESCADGLFCNGVERCVPGASDADARGCVEGEAPCDEGCDEGADRCSSECVDADGDGFGEGCAMPDCDDTDPDRFPGNLEVCDGERDEDCDPTTLGPDRDGDGEVSTLCCNRDASGALGCGLDCDDESGEVNTEATEVCNGQDEDCDGIVDEDTTGVRYFPDCDADGHGALGATGVMGCGPPTVTPAECAGAIMPRWADSQDDCDDFNGSINPGVGESCNGRDDDCDTIVDETLPLQDYYPDCDGDGFGSDTLAPVSRCLEPTVTPPECAASPSAAYSTVPTDCDDGRASVNTTSPEVCNGVDDDCNGLLDATGEDDDGDGYADAACGGPDCEDDEPAVYPGAPALCDGQDNDCDPTTDPGDDLDGDGHLPVGATCSGGDLDGRPRDDCGEGDPLVHPGAVEACNDVDDDCDGTVDGAAATGWCNAPANALPNATAACLAGACAVDACDAPYLDCSAAPGCELDGSADPANCGACGRACAWGVCAASACDDPIELAAGGSHGCALRPGGGLYCWGDNSQGQLGDGATLSSSTPRAVVDLSRFSLPTSGSNFTCAISSEETYCWGSNSQGQLGRPTTTLSSTNRPLLISSAGLSGVPLKIDAGTNHVCQLRGARGSPRGVPHCWGDNAYGQLGHGDRVDVLFPKRVEFPGNGDITDISAGHRHTCLIRTQTSQGYVYCAGENGSGQLGDGTSFDRLTFVRGASTISNAVQMAAGGNHTCVRRSDRTVACWGSNSRLQLGTGGVSSSTTPVTVSGLADVVDISAGLEHTCALREDGQALCWGSDQNESIGIGFGAWRSWAAPQPVTGLTDGVLIDGTANGYQTCAIRDSGVVSCWGRAGTVVRYSPGNIPSP